MKRFLAFVFLLFTLMLLALYVASEKADPVMLDEEGKPLNPPITVPECNAGQK